jgi:hypothetical protein
MTNCSDNHEFLFGTKAETLYRLKPLLKAWVVPTLSYISLGDWLEGREAVLDELTTTFGSVMVAVRSSAQGEDGAESPPWRVNSIQSLVSTRATGRTLPAPSTR